MPESLFLQNVIAVIWDFDSTLVPGYMQLPLFKKYGVDPEKFWREVNQLPDFYSHRDITVSPDTVYLNHILTYVKDGPFHGLKNKILEELGKELDFFDGLPGFFPTLKDQVEADPVFRKHDIKLEHYVVSTGLRRIIKGSAISGYVEETWGCEFIEDPAPKGYLEGGAQRGLEPMVSQLGYVIDNTTKTRALFEINKATIKFGIDVNASLAPEQRRIPFQNMIYIADGPSDIPSFSIINHYGGKTFAVYQPKSEKHFQQVYRLQEQGRVQSIGEADYREGSQTYLWISHTVSEMATRIASDRTTALLDAAKLPPGHIVEEQVKAREDGAEDLGR